MVRNITGEEEISPIRKHTANGCFLDTEFTTAIEGAGFPDLGGGLFLGNYGSLFLKFNAAKAVPTAEENRPYNVRLLPVLIY